MKDYTTTFLLVRFALPLDKRATTDHRSFPGKMECQRSSIRKFLAIINDAKVNIEVLSLDRGFYSKAVLDSPEGERSAYCSGEKNPVRNSRKFSGGIIRDIPGTR